MFAGEADSVSIPTTSGTIQVFEKHMPLVTVLAAGELKITRAGETSYLAVSSGFVEVRPGSEVVVLANTAEAAQEIDVDRAEAARARARDLLKGKIASDEQYATVMAALEKEFARVRIGKKHLNTRRMV